MGNGALWNWYFLFPLQLGKLINVSIFSFGSLFSGGERLGDPMAPIVNLKYSGAEEVTPAIAKERKSIRSPNNDVFDGDTL